MADQGQRGVGPRPSSVSTEPRIDADLPQPAKLSPNNRHALRSLSRSTPTMNRLETHTSFEVPRSQRKFLRRFKELDAEESIIKCKFTDGLAAFSCALVSDILLQGRLYITSHHFAFYSNLFGHVTRILIPCSLVLTITKEKTARIIPNAVAVLSSEGRHVFGSLLSRDSAYGMMVHVWRKKIGHDAIDLGANDKECIDDDEPSLLSSAVVMTAVDADLSESTASDEVDSAVDFKPAPPAPPARDVQPPGGRPVKYESISVRSASPPAPMKGTMILLLGSGAASLMTCLERGSTPHRSVVLLLLCNLLLVLIFCSSYASLNRMEEIQRHIWHPNQRIEEAEQTLSLHLRQLAMVRKSLEALSRLVVGFGDPIG